MATVTELKKQLDDAGVEYPASAKKADLEALLPQEEAAPEVETGIEASEKPSSYKEFEALIEAYKKQNPAKYELKKEELAAKLAKLK